MNYSHVLFRISQDESIPIYTRRFAALFICIIQLNNNKISTFSDLCEPIMMTYFHRLMQIIDNTIDPCKSRQDYDELKELVNSIHLEIRTNNNPKWIHDKISNQLSNYC